MKIINNVKQVKPKLFTDLAIGDIFRVKSIKNEKIYLKINNDFVNNSFCLNENYFADIDEEQECIILNCNLVIEGEQE
jgi:adenine-specific DNA methylase